MLPTTCLHGVQTIAGLQRGLVGLLRAIAGVGGVLIRQRGLRVGLTNTFLRARVDVFDLARILGGQIVQLIHAIANGRELALHILLAREGIDLSPEAFVCFRLQRLPCRQVLIRSGALRWSGWFANCSDEDEAAGC